MQKLTKISLLGPKGTFSEVACDKFLINNKLDLDKVFYPTILKTALSTKESGISILPFENTLDGYVFETMDFIVKSNYKIVSEVETKVEFAFVTNAKDINSVSNIYVQFKTKGQCLDFLQDRDYKTIITQSNMESYNLLLSSDETYGAIIPLHKASDDFNLVIRNVEDTKSNFTRFLVVTNHLNKFSNFSKASLWVKIKEDRPGILFELLKIFNDEQLNLNAIISRPTKQSLGKYNFYIEVSLCNYSVKRLEQLVVDVNLKQVFELLLLGSY